MQIRCSLPYGTCGAVRRAFWHGVFVGAIWGALGATFYFLFISPLGA